MTNETEQIKRFNEAYKIVKQKKFQNYFCLPETTWEEVNQRFNDGFTIQDEISIKKLQETVDLILNSKQQKCKSKITK